jgi:hypothetical protein
MSQHRSFRDVEAVRAYLKTQAQHSCTTPPRDPPRVKQERLGLILAAGGVAGGALGAPVAAGFDSTAGLVAAAVCVLAGIVGLFLCGGK